MKTRTLYDAVAHARANISRCMGQGVNMLDIVTELDEYEQYADMCLSAAAKRQIKLPWRCPKEKTHLSN